MLYEVITGFSLDHHVVDANDIAGRVAINQIVDAGDEAFGVSVGQYGKNIGDLHGKDIRILIFAGLHIRSEHADGTEGTALFPLIKTFDRSQFHRLLSYNFV